MLSLPYFSCQSPYTPVACCLAASVDFAGPTVAGVVAALKLFVLAKPVD